MQEPIKEKLSRKKLPVIFFIIIAYCCTLMFLFDFIFKFKKRKKSRIYQLN